MKLKLYTLHDVFTDASLHGIFNAQFAPIGEFVKKYLDFLILPRIVTKLSLAQYLIARNKKVNLKNEEIMTITPTRKEPTSCIANVDEPGKGLYLVEDDTRLPESQKEFFQYAANLGGYRTLSEFVIVSVQSKAEEIVEKHKAT